MAVVNVYIFIYLIIIVMFKLFKSPLFSFVIIFVCIYTVSSVQALSSSACISLTQNFKFGSKDTSKYEGEIHNLQQFLLDINLLTVSDIVSEDTMRTIKDSKGNYSKDKRGVFGDKTRKAVIAFQSKNGLVSVPAGFVGVGTRAKIYNASCTTVLQTNAKSIVTSPALTPSVTTTTVATTTPVVKSSSNNDISKKYGFFYLDYTQTKNDLADLVSYTNTMFAKSPEQVSLLVSAGFKNIIYTRYDFWSPSPLLKKLLISEGVTVTEDVTTTYDFRTIPNYETKVLALYKDELLALRNELIATNTLDKISTFYIADEPALHKNYIPNQAFLENIEKTFKSVFPDKKSMIAFAEDRQSTSSFRGVHMNPPSTLDIVGMDPYFLGNPIVNCSEESIKKFLFVDNANSAVNWAIQFNKPIYLIGDAMLRNGSALPDCYTQNTYNLAQREALIQGLIWYTYDTSFVEGELSGAANSTNLMNFIKNLKLTTPLVIPVAPIFSVIDQSSNSKQAVVTSTLTKSLTYTWNPISEATSYVFKVNNSINSIPVSKLISSSTSVSFLGDASILGITTPGTYNLSVQACNGTLCGAWSNSVAFAETAGTLPSIPPVGSGSIGSSCVSNAQCQSSFCEPIDMVCTDQPKPTADTPITLNVTISSNSLTLASPLTISVAPLPSDVTIYKLNVGYENPNTHIITWYLKGPFTNPTETHLVSDWGFSIGTYHIKAILCNTDTICGQEGADTVLTVN